MATYLRYFERARECAGCGLSVGPGAAGVTQDVLPGQMVPVCAARLHSLDQRLWRLVISSQCLDMTLRLVEPGKEPARLAEEVREVWRTLLDLLPELPAPEGSDCA